MLRRPRAFVAALAVAVVLTAAGATAAHAGTHQLGVVDDPGPVPDPIEALCNRKVPATDLLCLFAQLVVPPRD